MIDKKCYYLILYMDENYLNLNNFDICFYQKYGLLNSYCRSRKELFIIYNFSFCKTTFIRKKTGNFIKMRDILRNCACVKMWANEMKTDTLILISIINFLSINQSIIIVFCLGRNVCYLNFILNVCADVIR